MVKLFKAVLCFLVLVTLGACLAPPEEAAIPQQPTREGVYVVDTLNWLTPDQESSINATVAELDRAGVAQIAVVTLDNCGPDSQQFRLDLFREWGIGHKDVNNGLLILLCWYGGQEGNRSLEVEVGPRLEEVLPDTLGARIFERVFVPYFEDKDVQEVVQSGDAGKALMEVFEAYAGIVATGEVPEGLKPWPWWVWVLLILAILALIFIRVMLESGGGSSSGGGWYSSSHSSSGSSFGGGTSFGGGFSGKF